jgi:UDP-glucose 4-epimerase
VFRPHNVYGPRMGMVHVVPELLKKAFLAEDGDQIEVFSTEHTRCFCYIDDAIEILWRMLTNDSCEGKTLNLGTQNPEISIKEMAESCFMAVGKDLVIDPLPPSPGSPSRRGPDMRQTTELINYESQVGLDEGLQKTYAWYKHKIFEGGQVTAK